MLPIFSIFQLLTSSKCVVIFARVQKKRSPTKSFYFKRTQSVKTKVFFMFFCDENKIYWWENHKCWPLVQVILSMGYPLTGQTTENSLPTTARSSPSGWTWGGPRKKKESFFFGFCWIKSSWKCIYHRYSIWPNALLIQPDWKPGIGRGHRPEQRLDLCWRGWRLRHGLWHIDRPAACKTIYYWDSKWILMRFDKDIEI